MRESFSSLAWVCLISPLFLFPILASAEISQVGFTTDPHTMSPGEISGTITIQLQDASGSPSQATETFDIEFLSSSSSGEFLSPSSENPVTKTISSGSANKNFRYRDASSGSHTLTINAQGRVSGLKISNSQAIVVGGSSALPGTTASSEATEIPSAHFSASSLSAKKAETKISLSAGRDRIGSVGSPLEFKAETDLAHKRNTEFRWNFGDGSEEYGAEVNHTYDYPGEYVVVLSLQASQGRAIARVNVKIVDPKLGVVFAGPDRIEIKNASNQEVSLFGWAVWAHGFSFFFPQDTIIKPGQTLAFSSKVTKLRPNYIYEVQLLALGQTEQPKVSEKIEALKQEKITHLQNQLWMLQEELGSRLAPKISPSPSFSPSLVSATTAPETLPITAAAVRTLSNEENQPKTGWFATLKRFLLGNNKQSNK